MLIMIKRRGIGVPELERHLRGYASLRHDVLPSLLGALEGASEVIDFSVDTDGVELDEWGIPLECSDGGLGGADGGISNVVPAEDVFPDVVVNTGDDSGGSTEFEDEFFDDGFVDDGLVVEEDYDGTSLDNRDFYEGSSVEQELSRDVSEESVERDRASGGSVSVSIRDGLGSSGGMGVESTVVSSGDVPRQVSDVTYVPGMDLKDFVRENGGCDMDVALRYFSKERIEDAIMLGELYKRSGRLRA